MKKKYIIKDLFSDKIYCRHENLPKPNLMFVSLPNSDMEIIYFDTVEEAEEAMADILKTSIVTILPVYFK